MRSVPAAPVPTPGPWPQAAAALTAGREFLTALPLWGRLLGVAVLALAAIVLQRCARPREVAEPPIEVAPRRPVHVVKATDSPGPLFKRLCESTETVSAVELAPIKGIRERGLVATRDLLEGDMALDIPLWCCLTEPRDLPPDALPEGEQLPPSFTWDVRLAVKLLEAAEGRWSQFWAEYGPLLPAPTTLALPMLLPPVLLHELQHFSMEEAALEQQARLRGLFPELVPPYTAPPTAFPSPLMWAWALVRSRAFACGENQFAFVPFLDMANHADIPNAEFEFSPETGSFHLKAVRPIRQGQEVTISYGASMDNQRLFSQYGFVEVGGNPSDTLPIATAGLPLCRPRLRATLLASGQDPGDWQNLSPPLAAFLNSVPLLAQEGDLSAEEELRHVEDLLYSLRAVSATQCATTVEEDLAETQGLLASPGGDRRKLAVLIYRVERKILLHSATELLEDHRGTLMGVLGR